MGVAESAHSNRKNPHQCVGQVVQGGFAQTVCETLRLQNPQRSAKCLIAHFCGRSNAIMRKVGLR